MIEELKDRGQNDFICIFVIGTSIYQYNNFGMNLCPSATKMFHPIKFDFANKTDTNIFHEVTTSEIKNLFP